MNNAVITQLYRDYWVNTMGHNATINTYLSEFGGDFETVYPHLLIPPTSAYVPNYTKGYVNHNMELMAYTQWDVNASVGSPFYFTDKAEVWDYLCRELAKLIVNSAKDDTHGIVVIDNRINFELINWTQEDEVLGAKATFQVRKFDSNNILCNG